MLKGQTLDVWLDKMVETSKGYENEITQISVDNLEWAKSWVKQSKRSLENYLETSAKKRSKANNGKRVAVQKRGGHREVHSEYSKGARRIAIIIINNKIFTKTPKKRWLYIK